jgi:hypothetical protein
VTNPFLHYRPAVDLWEMAVQALSPADKLQFEFSRVDRSVILNDVLAVVIAKKQTAMEKRWKYTKRNGDVIILRDVFEKIIVWVNKFKEAGDVAVQYDPTHASLPWVAIRVLLQITVNDSQTFGAMAQGVEFISNLIARYAIVEHLYLQKPSAAKHQLTQAITKLYVGVLKYLLKSRRFYDRSLAGERLLTSFLFKTLLKFSRAHGIEYCPNCRDSCRRIPQQNIGVANRGRCLRPTCRRGM